MRPGKILLDYLQGKRKKYQKPISYFLIWTGIYILVHNMIANHYHLSELNFVQPGLREHASLLLRRHFTLFLIPIIFGASLLIYYILAKPKFNYIEILTLSVYGGGTYFMMLFVSDILLGAIFKVNILSTGVFLWQAILSALYNFWNSFDFFKRVHVRFLWLRLISVAVLVAIIGWAMLEYLPMAWVSLVK